MNVDLTGHKYARLSVLGLSHSEKWIRYWECRCDCGEVIVVRTGALRSGNTRSCGCLAREVALRNIKGARSPTTHGHARRKKFSGAYISWYGMLTRCENPKSTSYAHYGGRGVTVCPEWHDFQNFLRDMGERPHGWTLDRVDPNGNYCRENCRWATRKQQSQNRRPWKHKS